MLSIGGRITVTYPVHFMTLDLGFSVAGSQLRAAPDSVSDFYFLDAGHALRSYGATSWAPEVGFLVRWGTPELRVGGLSILLSAFFEITHAFAWQLQEKGSSGAAIDVSSNAYRVGIALRFRLGDLKPYY